MLMGVLRSDDVGADAPAWRIRPRGMPPACATNAADAPHTPHGRGLTWVLGQAPGFIAYVVLATGDRVLTAVSVFETQAELEGADRLVARWVAQHLATALPHPPRVTTGDVIIQRGM
jgi:hypothetical protein